MFDILLKPLQEQTRPRAEEIQNFAFLIYEHEGRPPGKASEHWKEAEAHLWAVRLAERLKGLDAAFPSRGRSAGVDLPARRRPRAAPLRHAGHR